MLSAETPWPLEPCPVCGRKLSRHGLPYWPGHEASPFTRCDASGLTNDVIQWILADRAEDSRPGRYVRPHP